MTIKEFQDKAHEFSFYPVPVIAEHHGSVTHKTNLNWTYACLEVAEESGELVGKFAKILRDNNGKIPQEKYDSIELEIGDVLWGLSEICSCLGIEFEDCFKKNIEKLESRKQRNKLSGSGDYR